MGAVDILKLRPAFNDEQAEALARLIDENLATKHDIEDLRKDLKLDADQARGDLIKSIVGMNGVTIGVLFTLIRFFG